MNDNHSISLKGACLCGAVRYEICGPAVVVAHCFCKDCRRGSGAGHSTGAMYPKDRFSITGQTAEHTLTSNNENTVTRVFCPTCGSPIYGRNTGMGGYVTITLGTLDDSSSLKPQVALFAKERQPWDKNDGSVVMFDEQPDWKPEDGI